MNNVFSINPKMEEKHNIVLWYSSKKSQEMFIPLTCAGIRINGFCFEKMQSNQFMGKKAFSILSLIEEGDFALITVAEEYDQIISKYKQFGLDEDNVFVWVDERKGIIYL